MSKFDPTDIRTVGEHEADFAKSDWGQWVLEQLYLQYNILHNEAEDAISSEFKAFKVERAAGVKIAINLLSQNAALLENGSLDDREGQPSS